MKSTLIKSCVLAIAFLIYTFSIPMLHAELRAAWEFDSGDISGSSVSATDGTAANSTGSLIADADASGGILTVDGAGDYLQFGNNLTDLRGLNAMTICAWVKVADSGTARRRIVEHEDNYYFYTESGRYKLSIHGSLVVTSTTTPAVDTWQHVLVTYQSGQPMKIYINGSWEANSSNIGAMANNTQTFQIGARRDTSGTPTDFLNGKIDDIGIWNEVLSVDQIEALAGKSSDGYAGRVTPSHIDDLVLIKSVPTAVGKTEATLNGILVNNGGKSTDVWLYWGPGNGGTNATVWANTNYFGSVDVGTFSTNLTALTAGGKYYYRFYAENSTESMWSDEGSFTTWSYLPDDLADLQLWLKADEGVYKDSGISSAVSGDVVTQWNDFSGNSYHATRSGSFENVTLSATASSMPMVQFTDLNNGDYLKTLGYQVADTNELTVFMVAKADPQTFNGSAIHPLLTSGTTYYGEGAFSISTMRPSAGGAANLGYFGRNYNTFPYDEFTSTNSTPNFSDGDAHVVALTLSDVVSGGNGTFIGYYDGEFTESHNGNTADPDNGPVEIGGSFYHPSCRFAGSFGDILIYDRVLSDDERNIVGWYLQEKYGVDSRYRKPYGILVSMGYALDSSWCHIWWSTLLLAAPNAFNHLRVWDRFTNNCL
ncbi:MAG: hypothetical protein PF904_03005, partial [Kiritimatiellae bacterium]|nr:hypothetical protein [Kiritimatiellia bacterium]